MEEFSEEPAIQANMISERRSHVRAALPTSAMEIALEKKSKSPLFILWTTQHHPCSPRLRDGHAILCDAFHKNGDNAPVGFGS